MKRKRKIPIKVERIANYTSNLEFIANEIDPYCWICERKNCKNCPLEKEEKDESQQA